MLSVICFVMPFLTKAEAVARQAISIGGEFHNGDDVRSACDFLPFADITHTTPVTPLIRMSIVQAD